MRDKPAPNFSDFMRDTDGEYSKAQILKIARALQAEGRRPDRIEKALVLVALHLATERGQDDRFLMNLRDWSQEAIDKTMAAVERLDEERRLETH